MRHKKIFVLMGGISVAAIAGYLYWAGSIPLDVSKKRDPIIYGRELLHAGKYTEAENVLKNALIPDPANVKVLSILGTVYYRKGDRMLAYQYWNEALKISPGDPILRNLIKALEQDRFKSGTLYHMDIQTADHAKPWEQHYVKGQNLYIKGAYREAVGELTEAINLRPDDPKIYFVLGAAYLKMNNRDQAIHAWENALRLNPEDMMIKELLDKVKK